jgi:hypothetical protein
MRKKTKGKKTKGKKTKAASYKAVVASVTKEMARPRVAESAQVAEEKRSRKSRGKPARQRAGRAAKPHVEEYGTGTPVEQTP